MKNKDMGYLLIGGAVAYLLLSQNNRSYNWRPQYQHLPPPPPRNRAQEYQQWIALILSTYGTIADLWAPGGPFHNSGVDPNDVGANFTGTLPDYSNIGRLAGRRPRINQVGRTCRYQHKTIFL